MAKSKLVFIYLTNIGIKAKIDGQSFNLRLSISFWIIRDGYLKVSTSKAS